MKNDALTKSVQEEIDALEQLRGGEYLQAKDRAKIIEAAAVVGGAAMCLLACEEADKRGVFGLDGYKPLMQDEHTPDPMEPVLGKVPTLDVETDNNDHVVLHTRGFFADDETPSRQTSRISLPRSRGYGLAGATELRVGLSPPHGEYVSANVGMDQEGDRLYAASLPAYARKIGFLLRKKIKRP